MAKYSKESLEKLLTLIDDICKDEENLWFKENLSKNELTIINTADLNVLHQDLRRTKSFLKYIDGQYWRDGFNYYKKIKDVDLKITLTSDFKEMKIAENENNILEFVRRLILQIENIMNFLIIHFDAFQTIKDNSALYISDRNNLLIGNYSFFLENGDKKTIKSISIASKLNWVKIYFNINYTYNIWNDLIFIRNKASHRETLSESDNEKIQRLENEWDIKKIEYNKFLNLFVKDIISHL
jgi:hypothetical protein